MTGFGRAEQSSATGSITIEARSVNNRYLNIKMKLPSRLLRHEAVLEQEVRKVVARGSVEILVRLRGHGRKDQPLVNERLVEEYLSSIRKLADGAKLDGDVDLNTVLSLPGVVTLEEADETDPKEVKQLRASLRQALEQLVAARAAEGERLAKELGALLGKVEKATGAIERQAPKIPARYKKRLFQRIDKLLAGSKIELERASLEREVALFADRADITEELARLKSHAEGFRGMLTKTTPIGRSLDFLVQEMAREANTIGSKNQDVSLGRHVVDLKSQVERLREQVQNLE